MWKMEEFTAIHIPGAMYTMWKFRDFFVTQILHEIILGHFEAPKELIFTILEALNYDFLVSFDIFQKSNFKASKWLKWQFLPL